MGFAKVTGQPRAVRLLQQDLAQDRVADSYLFCGPAGSGKRELALQFAKAFNCLKRREIASGAVEEETPGLFAPEALPEKAAPVQDACDDCSSCRKIEEGIHADVFVLDFETQAQLLGLKSEEKARQKDIRIDSVRELVARSQISPLESSKKVTILDESESLTPEASNALLKALEEAASTAIWVLIAVSQERILPTIQSRCRKIPFAGSALTEKPSGAQDALMEALENGQGASVQEALRASQAALSAKGSLTQRKAAENYLRGLLLRLELRMKESPTPLWTTRLERALEAQEDIRRNASPQIVFDSLFLKLLR